MKRIKTISVKEATELDRQVNNYLAVGWTLKKRGVLPPYDCGGHTYFNRMYYAELEMDDTPEDPTKPEEPTKLTPVLKALIKEVVEDTVDLVGKVVNTLAGSEDDVAPPPIEENKTEGRVCLSEKKEAETPAFRGCDTCKHYAGLTPTICEPCLSCNRNNQWEPKT